MKIKLLLGIVLLVAAVFAVSYYVSNRGFTKWMTYAEMDAYLAPLGVKDADGKNFWDRRHWLTAVEGRWSDGRPQFRLRIGDAPKTGQYWWWWWFNQDEKSYNRHIHDMADDHCTMVYGNSFEWPDGSKRYSGVWHRVEGE